MCNQCFKSELYRFDTEADFAIFERDLEQLLWKSSTFNLLNKREDDVGAYFLCDICGEIWELSIPENAWRGYFILKKNKLDLEVKIRNEQKNANTSCLFVFIVFLSILAILVVLIFS